MSYLLDGYYFSFWILIWIFHLLFHFLPNSSISTFFISLNLSLCIHFIGIFSWIHNVSSLHILLLSFLSYEHYKIHISVILNIHWILLDLTSITILIKYEKANLIIFFLKVAHSLWKKKIFLIGFFSALNFCLLQILKSFFFFSLHCQSIKGK